MGRKPDLTQGTITRIDTLYKAGYSVTEIVKETGVSQRSARRWVKKCRESSQLITPTQSKRPGLAPKLSTRTLKALKRQLNTRPTLTARQLKEENPALLGNVSVRTVSRNVQEKLDLPSRVAARKPLLTVTHKRNRVAFAKKCSTWPIEKVRAILWSDESMFTVTGKPSGRVRRPRKSDRYDQRYTVKSEKHPEKVMVWGAFSYHGVGKLYFLEKGVTMNTERYLELLYDNLEESFESCKAEIFMQDGAPCHTSKETKQWLSDCAVEYIQDWPGNSPDLNPIENLWSCMKNQLREKDTSSLAKLKAAVQSIWDNLSNDLLRKLVDSWPNRLKEVIKRKGNTTKY